MFRSADSAFWLLLLLTLLAGCSTFHPVVQTQGVTHTKRNQYQRFGFIRQTDSLHHEIDVPFRQIVEQVVTEQLAYRGYQLDAAQPDFLIAFHRFDKTTDLQFVDRQTVQRSVDEGIYESSDVVSSLTTRTHRIVRGNVLLQVYDVAQGQYVWQGYTTRMRPVRPESEQINTRYLIHSVIDRFPFRAHGYSRGERQAMR